MSPLATAQRDFLEAIFREPPAGDARMEIYRRNVLGNLRAALMAAYPVVLRLVGEAFFREAAERYAREVPSTSGDLNEYGAQFAAFLARYPHAAALDYLPDVARLEWAVHESHHAADCAPLDVAALARIAHELQGAIRFRLHPAVRLVASPHPILAIWEANQSGRDGTTEPDAGAARVLVRRIDSVATARALGPGDWTILAALERGASLDEVCGALGESAARFLAPALLRHAADGVLSGFEAPEGA